MNAEASATESQQAGYPQQTVRAWKRLAREDDPGITGPGAARTILCRYPGEPPPLPGYVRVHRGVPIRGAEPDAAPNKFFAAPGGAEGYASLTWTGERTPRSRPQQVRTDDGHIDYWDVPADDVLGAHGTIWLPHATPGHDPGTKDQALRRILRETGGVMPDFAFHRGELVPLTERGAQRMLYRGRTEVATIYPRQWYDEAAGMFQHHQEPARGPFEEVFPAQESVPALGLHAEVGQVGGETSAHRAPVAEESVCGLCSAPSPDHDVGCPARTAPPAQLAGRRGLSIV